MLTRQVLIAFEVICCDKAFRLFFAPLLHVLSYLWF